jgi:predicted kinase
MTGLHKSRSLKELLDALPQKGATVVDWDALQATALSPVFDRMARTEQNPLYHGEGNVWIHTKLVCEALLRLPDYQSASDEDRRILFLAALLHDIGKITCTRLQDGVPTSPHHASTGGRMARELLWTELGMSGSREARILRESVCLLIKNHSFPPYAIQVSHPERRLLKIASNGEQALGCTVKQLCTLEMADILGRISNDADECLERVAYCAMLAEEIGCLDRSYPFTDAHSRRAYFRGQTDWPGQELFKDTWGEVILLSGLPGTGKDTWIQANCPDLPMISLDDIRRRMGIAPTEPQGKVAVAAHEQAREYLRRKQPFVWNATNVTADMRSKQITLFEQYGAAVRTVFLETEWEEGLRRNSERVHQVPNAVIGHLLSKLEIPEVWECAAVEWQIT